MLSVQDLAITISLCRVMSSSITDYVGDHKGHFDLWWLTASANGELEMQICINLHWYKITYAK